MEEEKESTKPERPMFSPSNIKMADWIDEASYEDLLVKWRFTKVGDPFFTNHDISKYYQHVMLEKKRALPPHEAFEISHRIGWDVPERDEE